MEPLYLDQSVVEPCAPAISTFCQDQSVVKLCAPAINTIGIFQYLHDQPTSFDHSSKAKQVQWAHVSSPSGMTTHLDPNSLISPTSKPNPSTSPTSNTDPTSYPSLVHTHNFISTPQQHTPTDFSKNEKRSETRCINKVRVDDPYVDTL